MTISVVKNILIKSDILNEQEKASITGAINYLNEFLDYHNVYHDKTDKGVLFTIQENNLESKYKIMLSSEKVYFEKTDPDSLAPKDGFTKFSFESSQEEFKSIFGEDVCTKLVDLVMKLNARKS